MIFKECAVSSTEVRHGGIELLDVHVQKFPLSTKFTVKTCQEYGWPRIHTPSNHILNFGEDHSLVNRQINICLFVCPWLIVFCCCWYFEIIRFEIRGEIQILDIGLFRLFGFSWVTVYSRSKCGKPFNGMPVFYTRGSAPTKIVYVPLLRRFF